MNTAIHLTQYTLTGESMAAMKEPTEGVLEQEHAAVATWRSTYDELQITTTSWYYPKLSVKAPMQFLNDEHGNPIWVIQAWYTFSNVAWRYAENGEFITDHCGKRGQVDSRFTAPKANIFQLLAALRERSGQDVIFNNGGCSNPGRFTWTIGGRLAVIVNDAQGAYGDNSGSFDLMVEVLEFLP